MATSPARGDGSCGDAMDKRSALIVATESYTDAGLTRLRAPGADAEALADVLGDPDIGGFEVRTVVNQAAHEVTRAIAQFFADRRQDDLLLLHLSCHGVKDDSGELYFAATDTALDLLEATAVSSSFVNRVMERSRAGRVLLLLDCCYSGAFARGLTSRAGGSVDVNERLGGKGRAVITASSALQFAFEGQRLTDGDIEASEPSVFTSALVRGLRTGDADRDRDGWVSLDELYAYLHDEVTKVTPDQTPKKWAFDVQGDLYVARRGRPVDQPSTLPSEIIEAMESLVPWNRLGVVEPLRLLLTGAHPGLALGARQALEQMAESDDSDRVKQAAREALAAAPPVEAAAPAPPSSPPPAPTPTPEATSVEPIEASPPPPLPPGSEAEPERPREPDGSGPATVRRTPRLAVVGAVVAVLLVAALIGWLLLRDDPTTTATDERTTESTGEPSISSAEPAVGGGALPAKELLVTERNDDGTRDLLAVDTFSGETRVVINDEPVSNPNISVDRTWMVYREGAEGTPQRPMLAHPSGAARRPLMESSADCVGTGRPAWSHDGGRLAVVCLSADNRSTGLRIVTLDGEVGAPIVTSDMLRESPTWTGHDTVIYGQTDEFRGPVALMEIPADGTKAPEEIVSADGYWVSQLDWSDTGLLFIRASAYGASGDVWLRDPDGALTPLSTTGDVTSVSWSPDGLSAVYTTGSDPSSFQTLWVMRFGTDDPREIMDGALGPPSWASR